MPCRKCISFIRTLQVRINRSKTENDKQMSLNDFLLSLFSKVCTSYVAVVQQTLISLAVHNLNWFNINNLEKFTTQSSKSKLHNVNSQTVSSYPVRFSTDTLFSSLVSFVFCLPIFYLFVLFCFALFLNWKYIFCTNSTMRADDFHPADFRE